MLRLSRRFDGYDFEGGPAPLAAALRRRREAGGPLYDLTVSNPTEAGLLFPPDELKAALAKASGARYAPDPRGLVTAREAVAAYYGERGWPATPDDFFLTSGTSEGYALLFALLCNSGDSVLAPAPGYPLFEFIAAYMDVSLAYYRLRPPSDEGGHWAIDFKDLAARISDTTRAVIAVQPGNPTGSVLHEDETSALIALAESRGLALIVDEVFCDYCREDINFRPVRSDRVPVFTLNGISKVLALPQLKLSWMRLDGPEGYLRAAAERLEMLCDTLLSVNTPVQAALPALMAGRSRIQGKLRGRLAANWKRLETELAASSRVTARRPEGGWYAVLDLPPDVDEEAFALRLVETEGVHVHPGHMFGFTDGSRAVVSLITEPEMWDAGLARLSAALHR